MSETALVRLLVADDHPIVAEGLRRYLAPAEGLRVVDTLGTIGELFNVAMDVVESGNQRLLVPVARAT